MSDNSGHREIQYVGEEGAVVREAVAALDDEIVLRSHETVEQARTALSGGAACVVCDQQLPDESGLAGLEQIREVHQTVPVLFVATDRSTAEDAVAGGATDVFVRGSETEGAEVLAQRLRNVVATTRQLQREDRPGGELAGDGLSDLLLDSLNDLFYLLDTDGTLVRWNEQFTDVTGYTDDALAEMHALELFEGDDRHRVEQAIETVIETGKATLEANVVTKDGSHIPIDWTGALLTDTDGDARGIVGIGRDISKRKERERRLELAETVFQQTREAVFLIDVVDEQTFHVERVNGAYEQLTGVDAAAVEGQTPTELLGEERGAEVVAHYQECLKRGEPIEYEEELSFDDERQIWQTSLGPVTDDGKVTKLVGATRDITDQKRRIEYLQQIRQNVSDVIWMSDRATENMEFISESYETVWGRSTDSLRAAPQSFVDAIHPEDRDRVTTALDKQRENPDSYDETYRVVHPDGEVRWVHDRSSGIYEDGELKRVVGIASDITERKKREQKLSVRTQAIEEAPIGITIHDATTREPEISYANQGFTELTGYNLSALDGTQFSVLRGADTDEHRFERVQSAFDRDEHVSEVVLLYHRNGSPFWGRITLAPVTDDAGETSHFIGFLQDVTESKEHEQQIQRRLNEFGEVLAEDLRLPVEDARQSLDAVKEDGEPSDIEAAERAFERVESMIDDLVTVHSETVKSRDTFDRQQSATRDQ